MPVKVGSRWRVTTAYAGLEAVGGGAPAEGVDHRAPPYLWPGASPGLPCLPSWADAIPPCLHLAGRPRPGLGARTRRQELLREPSPPPGHDITHWNWHSPQGHLLAGSAPFHQPERAEERRCARPRRGCPACGWHVPCRPPSRTALPGPGSAEGAPPPPTAAGVGLPGTPLALSDRSWGERVMPLARPSSCLPHSMAPRLTEDGLPTPGLAG